MSKQFEKLVFDLVDLANFRFFKLFWYKRLTFAFALSVLTFAKASDYELWLDSIGAASINSRWAVGVQATARFDQNARELYLYFLELTLIKRLNYDWSLVPGYRFARVRLADAGWKLDMIPSLALVKDFQVNGFSLNFRSRLEYRTLPELWLYRVRCICDFPNRLSILQLRPSLFTETFFRPGPGLVQYRVFSGFRNNYARFGYMYRSLLRTDSWSHDHVLFLSLLWRF